MGQPAIKGLPPGATIEPIQPNQVQGLPSGATIQPIDSVSATMPMTDPKGNLEMVPRGMFSQKIQAGYTAGQPAGSVIQTDNTGGIAPAPSGLSRFMSRLGSIVKSIPAAINPMPQDDVEKLAIASNPIMAPMMAPTVRALRGQFNAEKQLGPQLVQQSKDAMASHAGEMIPPLFPNWQDVRAVNTGLSMLNPFASASVANVNALQDQGEGNRATAEGLADATFLGAGLALPKIPAAASGLRNLAMDAPEVAAQKALRPPMRGAINAQRNLAGARPYLQGAESLEDLQSKIPVAKAEIWKPYQDVIDSPVGDKPVQGPDGPTTVRELEQQRLEASAQRQQLKKLQPSDQQTLLQKNQGIADLERRYQQITDALDPELRNAGIDPELIRQTHGNVKGIQRLVEGRNTVTENSPYGFGKSANEFELTKPGTWLPSLWSGARDIVAGRPLWSGSPTDVAVKEGFRVGGDKPNLSVPRGITQPQGMPVAAPNPLPQPQVAATVAPNPPATVPPNLAAQLRAQIDAINAKPLRGVTQPQSAPQGGHAGNAVSSVEELNRPGLNYTISKGNQVGNQGKSFAPESTPSGGVHVTVLPDGSFRVNAGSMTPAQEAALRRTLAAK